MLPDLWTRSSRCASNACLTACWTSSSYSMGNGQCVQCRLGGGWRKSSRSGANGCVEATHRGVVQVRDSKDPDGPILSFTPDRWAEFLAAVRSGELRAN